MNYRDQEKFIRGSRIWGAVFSLCLVVSAIPLRFVARGRWSVESTVAFLLAALAVAVLIYYTPDYLHLSVRPERKFHWEIKIRWRIAAAVLIFGILLASSNGGRMFAVIVALCIAGINWAAARQKIPRDKLAAIFWTTDLVLIFVSLMGASAGQGAIILLLLAAAAHIAIVRREDGHLRWAGITLASGIVLATFAVGSYGLSHGF